MSKRQRYPITVELTMWRHGDNDGEIIERVKGSQKAWAQKREQVTANAKKVMARFKQEVERKQDGFFVSFVSVSLTENMEDTDNE